MLASWLCGGVNSDSSPQSSLLLALNTAALLGTMLRRGNAVGLSSAVPLSDSVVCLYKVLAKSGTSLTVRGLTGCMYPHAAKTGRKKPQERHEPNRKQD